MKDKNHHIYNFVLNKLNISQTLVVYLIDQITNQNQYFGS